MASFTKPAIYARVIAFVVDYVENNCETKAFILLLKVLSLEQFSRETLILVKVVVLETVFWGNSLIPVKVVVLETIARKFIGPAGLVSYGYINHFAKTCHKNLLFSQII